MRVIVTSNSTFGEGQVLSTRENIGFYLDGSFKHQDPSFTNLGTINISSSLDGYEINGIYTGNDLFYQNSVVHNGSTGVLNVTTTGVHSTAIGCNIELASFVNDGLISVSATNGFAVGLINFSLMGFGEGTAENNGDILVSGDDSVALYLFAGGELTNTGNVEAHGSSSAVGVLSYQDNSTVVNSGAIVATSDEFASIAIFELSTNGGNYVVDNSGLIEGDYAFYMNFDIEGPSGEGAVHLTNSGTMNGIIDMGSFQGSGAYDDDEIFNTGTINGTVFLGTSNDVYDGTSGIQNGDLYGGFGDDRIVGTAGADAISGDEGDDTITGGGSDDLVIGGSGYDVYVLTGERLDYTVTRLGNGVVRIVDNVGDGGTDTIADFELLRFADTGVRLTQLKKGTAGDDTMNGDKHDNTLLAFAGDDTMYGGRGNDTLSGGDGEDSIYGGAGDDFIDGGVNFGLFDGGGGNDTVSFASLSTDLAFDLRDPLYFLKTVNVENLVGTPYNDTLTGDGAANRLNGSAGDDILDGGAGHDVLDGGDGVDMASFASSASAVTVELGKSASHTGGDTFLNIEGVIGSSFADTITGTALDDIIEGGNGNDTLKGAAGFDFVSYAHVGGATVHLDQQGAAQNTGSSGNDTLTGFEGIIGGDDDDSMFGDDGDNVFVTGYGSNSVDGGDGIDVVVFDRLSGSYSIEAELLFGGGVFVDVFGVAVDTGCVNVEFLQFTDRTIAVADLPVPLEINGTDADETLNGDVRDDVIYGNGGSDRLNGGEGFDQLDGGTGNDLLVAGLGGDYLYGGDGIDTAVIAGERADYILFYVGGNINVSGVGGATLSGVEFIQFADATVAVPTSSFGSATGTEANDSFTFGAIDDVAYGRWGDDTIYGGDGNDLLDGGDGNDTLDGGAGIDTVSFASNGAGVQVSLAVSGPQDTNGEGIDTLSGFENLNGTAFDDVLTGDATDNIFEGGAGDDQINGGSGIDTATYVHAGAGVTVDLNNIFAQNTIGAGTDTLTGMENLTGSRWNDQLTGNASVNVLSGGAADDTLNGGFAQDALSGGDGNDRLIGGRAADVLDGGAGADIFAFEGALDSRGSTFDTINGFDASIDGIDVPVAITGIDAWVTAGTVSAAHFSSDVNALIGHSELHASHAVLFTPDGGDLAGVTFLLVDLDGEAGWSPSSDLVLRLNAATNLAGLSVSAFT